MAVSKDLLPSRHVTEGVGNAFHRVYYYAMGLSKHEIHQPHVGVVAAWEARLGASDSLRDMAEDAKQGVWAHGGTPREFTTIAGPDSASASATGPTLVARELIADSVELTVRGHSYDAIVGLASSDVALAGLAMAALRLDVASVVVPCEPAPGARPVLGDVLSALGLAAVADDPGVPHGLGHTAGARVMEMLDESIRPRQTTSAATLAAAAWAAGEAGGGSAALLHLLALANEAGVEVALGDLVEAASSGAAGRGRRARLVSGAVAPDGAVAWMGAGAPVAVAGQARVFDDEPSAVASVESGELATSQVLVIRGQGPRTGPGVRELSALERALAALPRPPAAVLTDGVMGVVEGTVVVSAVTPEADAGPIGLLRDGDPVRVDVDAGLVEHDGELADRQPSPAREADADAVLWKYAHLVGPAIAGALTHPGATAEAHCYADL